jgi:hypothetical protein
MLTRTLAVAAIFVFTQLQTAAIAGSVSERNDVPAGVSWRAYGWGAYDICPHGYAPWGYSYACLNDHGRPHCGCWRNPGPRW